MDPLEAQKICKPVYSMPSTANETLSGHRTSQNGELGSSPEIGSELKIQIDPEFRLPELDELRSSLPSVFVLTVSHVASFLSLSFMYLCRLHSFARFFSGLMCRLCSDFICNGSLKSEQNRSNIPSKIAIFNEPCAYDFSLNALFWRI